MRPASASIRLRAVTTLAVLVAAAAAIASGCASDPAPAAAGEAALDVQNAPWASQPKGAPRIADVDPQPSLRFPPGVTYGEALEALFRSARESGTTPKGVEVLDPLPAEVVYVAPDAADDGLRLSLTAPWGWVPETGAIRAPSVSLPGSLSPGEVEKRLREMRTAGAALPEGGEVDVPDLQACEIARGAPERRPPCD
jgi:hypothetical protein